MRNDSEQMYAPGRPLGPLAGPEGAALRLLEARLPAGGGGRAARSAARSLAPLRRAPRARPAPVASRTSRSPRPRTRARSASRAASSRRKTIASPHQGAGRRARGDGQEQSRSVARPPVRGDGAAMANAAQRLEREVDDLPARAPAWRPRRSRCRKRFARPSSRFPALALRRRAGPAHGASRFRARSTRRSRSRPGPG